MKIIACIICAFACLGCSKREVDETDETVQALRLNFLVEPPHLDPRKGGDMASSTIQFMLFEGLTKMTPESTHALGLAEKIELSEDRRVYTFHLKDAQWSNGDSVTAFDFENSWKDMLDPLFPSPNANLLYPIKNAKEAKMGIKSLDDIGIHAIDDKTLIVELEIPTPYFLELTSFCALFPTNHKVVDEHPDWAETANLHFVSNGPFRLKKYALNDEIILERNPLYNMAGDVKLDEIRISLINNENTAFDLYDQGKLDMIGLPFTNIPVDYIPHLKRKNANMHPRETAGTVSFYFNTGRFHFISKNIRKAFAYAVDRKSLCDNITQMGEIPGVDNTPPVVKRGKVSNFIYDADPVRAKACFQKGLEEIGLQKHEFPEVTLLSSNAEIYQKIAQVLQENWMSTLGVQVKIENVDFKVYLDKMVRKSYLIGLGGWIYQYNDAMNVLERYKYKSERKNVTGWENQQYIDYLDASMLADDEDERFEILEQAENILMDELPTVPLYHMVNSMLINEKLKGLYISPIGSIHLENVHFE